LRAGQEGRAGRPGRKAGQEGKDRSLSAEELAIAAQALSLGLTLVTEDSVFEFVDGLKTEDWTVA
jgi:predicted nucleic acid-binding protein